MIPHSEKQVKTHLSAEIITVNEIVVTINKLLKKAG